MKVTAYIKVLLSEYNRIDLAISELKLIAEQFKENENDIVLIEARFNGLNKKLGLGVLSKEEATLGGNQISESVLQLVNEFKKYKIITNEEQLKTLTKLRKEKEDAEAAKKRKRQSFQKRKRFRKYSLLGLVSIWFGLGCLFLFLSAQIKESVDVEFTILADRVQMRLANEYTFGINQKVSNLEVDGFDYIKIIAPYLHFRSIENNPNPIYLQKGFQLVEGEEDDPFYFKPLSSVILKDLTFPAYDSISISIANEASVLIEGVKMKGSIQSIDDSMSFEVTNMVVEELGLSALKTNGYALNMKGQSNFKIMFDGTDDPILKFKPDHQSNSPIIKELGILVSDIEFKKRGSVNKKSQIISSIKEGAYKYINRNDFYHENKIQENEVFGPDSIIHLAIRTLSFTKEGIKISAVGEVLNLKKGQEFGKTESQNPSILKWLWFNQKNWILVPVLIGLFITIIILIKRGVKVTL